MRKGIASVLMLIGGCDASSVPDRRSPSLRLVERIEHDLGKVPCIGDVRHWRRSYYFHADRDGSDYSRVDVTLWEAVLPDSPPKREIIPLAAGDLILVHDERPIRFVLATYDLQARPLGKVMCDRN